VEDDVRAEVERLLEIRRGEGVVDGHERAGRMGRLGGAADVDDVQQRVRRRLDPDEAGVVAEVRGEALVELLGRDVGELVALRLVDLRGHPVDAAVDVGDQHDALARVDQVQERRRCAEAGRERDPVLGALEACERLLERDARRVRGARVVVALVDADRLLDVGGGLVDRRDDRAGCRVRILPGMDCTGFKLHRPSLAASERRDQAAQGAVEEAGPLEPREVAAARDPRHPGSGDQLRRRE
jgi:hypothetical protein